MTAEFKIAQSGSRRLEYEITPDGYVVFVRDPIITDIPASDFIAALTKQAEGFTHDPVVELISYWDEPGSLFLTGTRQAAADEATFIDKVVAARKAKAKRDAESKRQREIRQLQQLARRYPEAFS